MKILIKIAIIAFLAIPQYARSLDVRHNKVYVINIGKKTVDRKIWLMTYIISNDSVFSGNYFTGYNFSCKLDQKLIDSILTVPTSSEESVFKLKKRLDKLKMHSFNSSNDFLNTQYFWSCVAVDMTFVLAPCKIVQQDFLEDIYREYNGLYPISVNLRSIRTFKHLPSFFYKFLEENIKE